VCRHCDGCRYGDVVHMLLYVLPRLPPGVIVHVHDIFLPDDYPSRCSSHVYRWDADRAGGVQLGFAMRELGVLHSYNEQWVHHHMHALLWPSCPPGASCCGVCFKLLFAGAS
jgi:hypothetical protein